MAIRLTNDEVLTLMQELGSAHWMYRILLEELNEHSRRATSLTPIPLMAAQSEVKDTIYFDAVDRDEHEPNLKSNSTSSSDLVQCRYSFYGNRCANYSENEFCLEHLGEKCSVKGCDNQMDHGCPYPLQFVCGSPLCSAHPSCASH